jgi:hypothetical protein
VAGEPVDGANDSGHRGDEKSQVSSALLARAGVHRESGALNSAVSTLPAQLPAFSFYSGPSCTPERIESPNGGEPVGNSKKQYFKGELSL